MGKLSLNQSREGQCNAKNPTKEWVEIEKKYSTLYWEKCVTSIGGFFWIFEHRHVTIMRFWPNVEKKSILQILASISLVFKPLKHAFSCNTSKVVKTILSPLPLFTISYFVGLSFCFLSSRFALYRNIRSNYARFEWLCFHMYWI